VDSYNLLTDFGAVLEAHEAVNGFYNNIFGRVYAIESPPGEIPDDFGTDPDLSDLPPR
jgi:hypothetical protein